MDALRKRLALGRLARHLHGVGKLKTLLSSPRGRVVKPLASHFSQCEFEPLPSCEILSGQKRHALSAALLRSNDEGDFNKLTLRKGQRNAPSNILTVRALAIPGHSSTHCFKKKVFLCTINAIIFEISSWIKARVAVT